METDQPDNHRLSRISGLVAVAGLAAVAVGGYLYYQNATRVEATSELLQQPASPPPSTQAPAAPGNVADVASTSSSQQGAADANAPTGNPPNPDSQSQAPSRTSSDNATKPAAPAPENAKPTSLPTNDVAYVQKSGANIRAEPNVRGKRVGTAPKGTKLNVVSRAGKWVQVESGETTGWISEKLLGARAP